MPSAEPTAVAVPLLAVDGIHVAYGADVALEDVSLTVQPGEAVALIGPNGAGKSTLLKAILGILPLVDGTVSVLGRPPHEVRASVAYVPQADSLDAEFPISVLQVVLMGRYRSIGWGRRPRAADRQRALDALEEVRLRDRAGDRFGVLTGGQRQRVLLARAIAQEAQLLLLDEPFNGLDATTTDILIEVLGRLRADGVGVVMSTHDLAVAHLTCGDACLLNRRRVGSGPIDETLSPELLAAAYGHRAVVLASGATVVTADVRSP
jgi:manganese/iron transport system ATP-binding protein